MTPQFFYHALGVGLGGRITRPFCDVIEAQAATALPIVGGYASNHVDGYRFHDIVSVRSARIHAVGTEDKKGGFNTSVSVTVEGLNILDVVTAESITARLSSFHGPDDAQPRITALGSNFRDLRIGGRPIDVELDHLFYQERTHDQFKYYVTREANPDAVSKQFLWGRTDKEREEFGECVPQVPPERPERPEGPEGPERNWPEAKGTVRCSLVRRLGAEMPELSTRGYTIKVPMVGTLFLGEVLVSEYQRRLTMLRLEMGSPVEGRLEVASGGVDGSTYP
jgi:hypothetical protein